MGRILNLTVIFEQLIKINQIVLIVNTSSMGQCAKNKDQASKNHQNQRSVPCT